MTQTPVKEATRLKTASLRVMHRGMEDSLGHVVRLPAVNEACSLTPDFTPDAPAHKGAAGPLRRSNGDGGRARYVAGWLGSAGPRHRPQTSGDKGRYANRREHNC